MKTTRQWLDATKTALDVQSDYALAKRLGVRGTRIANYRTERSFLDEDMALRIAEALGIDAGLVLASAAAERAKRPDVKQVWERIAKTMTAAVFTLFFVGFSLFGGSTAKAATDLKISPTGLYIMRSARWLRRGLAALFRRRLLAALSASALFFLASTAEAGDWSTTDTQLKWTYTIVHVVDWAQTRDISRQPTDYFETNPLLGTHPSTAKVDEYFAATLAAQWAIAYALPPRYRRYYQVLWIGIEAGHTGRNTSLGIKLSF